MADGTFPDIANKMALVIDINNPSYSSFEGALFNKDRVTLIAYPNSKSSVYTIP
jgi:hypothetical protein